MLLGKVKHIYLENAFNIFKFMNKPEQQFREFLNTKNCLQVLNHDYPYSDCKTAFALAKLYHAFFLKSILNKYFIIQKKVLFGGILEFYHQITDKHMNISLNFHQSEFKRSI
uniref:(northern house mosquito) hypothetical protein n=1 Tax=Culex pipiens TaxID=7175 RepID=A0A8D8AC49_CULPI